MAEKKNGAVKLDLTPQQRAAILDRDGHTCQSQLHSRVVDGHGKVKGSDRLEVDHVVQKRYALSILGWNIWEINTPENLLSKCKTCHTGHPESHHPDTLEADWAYRNGDKQAYRKMVTNREVLLANGLDYGNNKDREQDLITAEENTRRYEETNPGFWPWSRRNRH